MSALVEPTLKKELSLMVVQLGSEAEVFRSLMALKAIKHLYPEGKLNFMVRKEVSSAAKRVEWLHQVIETPAIEDASAYRDVALWVDKIIDENYDILVNWTFSDRYARLAGLVTSLIPAMVKLGDFVREDMSLASFDAWAMYRQAWVKESIDQDIHTTDIITTQLLTALQIHAGDPHPEVGATAVTSRYFFKNITADIPMLWAMRPKSLKWVAVDASSIHEPDAKVWMDSILLRHPDTGIVVLGKPQFKINADAEFESRIIVIDDELSTNETIHILSSVQWMISGKSHFVDLASLMNVRVVYLAQPHWSVDGPYGNGHVVLENANAHAIYAVWSYYHSEWFHKGTFSLVKHFENLSSASHLENVNVYRARIRPSQEGGGVSYEKIVPEAFTFESWMTRVRGQMARAWFCGWLPSVDAEVESMKLSPTLIKRIRELQESVNVITTLSREGKAIAHQLYTNTENLKSAHVMSVDDREQVEASGKKLLEIEALISRVVSVEPELKCILKFYQILMHNLNGNTISQMAKESIQAFDLLDEGADLIAVYAQKTLNRAKPKSIAEIKPQTIST